jgi:hypothetical protein
MLTCVNPTLDRPVILFQDVIKILNRSVLTVLLQNAISFELNDGWWISSVLVGIDYPRCRMARSAQSFCEKTLSRGRVLLG